METSSSRNLPIVLMGEHGDVDLAQEHWENWGFGMIFTTKNPWTVNEHVPWAFDNGAWGNFSKKKEFDGGRFLQRLRRIENFQPMPIFGVLPDIVAGGWTSLRFSLAWQKTLPKWFPWYLAVQDGFSPKDVLFCLDKFEGIFLGGSNEYKYRAEEWCKFAHSHGKKFHYGRCGSQSKLREAIRIGADSVDSASPILARINGKNEALDAYIATYVGGDPQYYLL